MMQFIWRVILCNLGYYLVKYDCTYGETEWQLVVPVDSLHNTFHNHVNMIKPSGEPMFQPSKKILGGFKMILSVYRSGCPMTGEKAMFTQEKTKEIRELAWNTPWNTCEHEWNQTPNPGLKGRKTKKANAENFNSTQRRL